MAVDLHVVRNAVMNRSEQAEQADRGFREAQATACDWLALIYRDELWRELGFESFDNRPVTGIAGSSGAG